MPKYRGHAVSTQNNSWKSQKTSKCNRTPLNQENPQYDPSQWEDPECSPKDWTGIEEDIKQIRELFPEVSHWSDNAINSAWSCYSRDVSLVCWDDPSREILFLEYILTPFEWGNKPGEKKYFPQSDNR